MTVIVIIIVAAMVFAYVLPMAVLASTVPPPPPQDDPSIWVIDDPEGPWNQPEEEPEEKLIPRLTITSTAPTLNVGQQEQLHFVMEDFPEGTLPEWSTSNPSIVVVNDIGVIRAVAPGRTDVILRAGDLRASLLVTVSELKANRVVIDLITEDIARTGPRQYEISVGDVIRLSARIEPEGAKVDRFSWTLGNADVASLSASTGHANEFIATAIGRTSVIVTADSLMDEISITIVESGVPVDQIWVWIRNIVILVVIIVAVAVVLTLLVQRHKKQKARQKAIAAKRRREEAERRAREEAAMEMQRDMLGPRAAQPEERMTMKVSGTAVGAGLPPLQPEIKEPERPVTLDDLD